MRLGRAVCQLAAALSCWWWCCCCYYCCFHSLALSAAAKAVHSVSQMVRQKALLALDTSELMSQEDHAAQAAWARSECNARIKTGFLSMLSREKTTSAGDCVLCVSPPAAGTHTRFLRKDITYANCRYEISKNGKNAACRMIDVSKNYGKPSFAPNSKRQVTHEMCCSHVHNTKGKQLPDCEGVVAIRRESLDLFDGNHHHSGLDVDKELRDVQAVLPNTLLPHGVGQRTEDVSYGLVTLAAPVLGNGPEKFLTAFGVGEGTAGFMSSLAISGGAVAQTIPSGVSGVLGLIVDGVALRRTASYLQLLEETLDRLANYAVIFGMKRDRSVKVTGSTFAGANLVTDRNKKQFVHEAIESDPTFKDTWEIWVRAHEKVC
eukprot:INCI13411.3.p1 GENE.INCI13411.3~~INCI13411.3.p1  ORF type:complete len:376 (+),score=52.14 INCI13411.3:104-1231(+)